MDKRKHQELDRAMQGTRPRLPFFQRILALDRVHGLRASSTSSAGRCHKVANFAAMEESQLLVKTCAFGSGSFGPSGKISRGGETL